MSTLLDTQKPAVRWETISDLENHPWTNSHVPLKCSPAAVNKLNPSAYSSLESAAWRCKWEDLRHQCGTPTHLPRNTHGLWAQVCNEHTPMPLEPEGKHRELRFPLECCFFPKESNSLTRNTKCGGWVIWDNILHLSVVLKLWMPSSNILQNKFYAEWKKSQSLRVTDCVNPLCNVLKMSK